MGFHVCEYCGKGSQAANRFENTSSGDVNLTFANGHRWVMPDMILHYVADHGWQPPAEFIQDAMTGELADSGRIQTRGMSMADVLKGMRIGYLNGPLEAGPVPEGFVEKLQQLMEKAGSSGLRVEAKSAPVFRG